MVWQILSSAFLLFWRRIGTLLIANLLWLGLSLLVVTWPAATVGLFYLVRRIIEEEHMANPQPAAISDFWIGFRTTWRASTIFGFGDLLCWIVIVVSLIFYGSNTFTPLNWLVGPITLVGIAWGGAQLYLFPLLIHRPERKLWEIAREAFLMAISYPLNTFSLLLTIGVLGIAATILAGPILLVFFSFLAMLQTMAMRFILAQRGELVLKLSPDQREERERIAAKEEPR
jgi:uncharacterized membrane protein YesL